MPWTFRISVNYVIFLRDFFIYFDPLYITFNIFKIWFNIYSILLCFFFRSTKQKSVYFYKSCFKLCQHDFAEKKLHSATAAILIARSKKKSLFRKFLQNSLYKSETQTKSHEYSIKFSIKWRYSLKIVSPKKAHNFEKSK